MIDSIDDSALWLTVGEGAEREDGAVQLGCLTRSGLFNTPAVCCVFKSVRVVGPSSYFNVLFC